MKFVALLLVFAAGYVGARALSGPVAPSVPPTGVADGNVMALPSAVTASSTSISKQYGAGAMLAEMIRAKRRSNAAVASGGQNRGDLQAWAAADPAGLWEFMQAGGWETQNDIIGLDRTLFRNWFRIDPDAAIAAIERTHRYAQHNGRWAMFGLIFDDDPEVARAAGERLDLFASSCRPQPGEHLARARWRAGLDTVERLMALPETNTKKMLIEVAVGGWAERDWREARDWVASLPQPQRAAMERAIFNGAGAWNQIREPEGIEWTKEWLAREENRDMRSKWGGELVEALARKDPAAALDWAGENLGGQPLAEAVGTIVEKQFDKDPEAAITLVDSLPPGGIRQRAGTDLIRAMAPKEPWEAFDRALVDLDQGYDIGRGVWGKVGGELAKSDPDGVWAVLDDLPDEIPWFFQERIYLSLPEDQAERTLERALELDGGYGDWIYSHAWRQLNKIDPAAAAKWEELKPKE